jgi:MFS family permease
MLGLSTMDASSTFWDLFPWLFIGGLGFGLIVPAITAAVMSSVPIDQGGVASGAMQAFRQLGGGLGVAIFGAIVASHVGDLPPGAPGYALKFVGGYQDAMLLGAIVSFASAIAAVSLIRRHGAVAHDRPAEIGI